MPPPSVVRRIPLGVLVALGVGLLYVGIPSIVESELGPHGVTLGFDRTTVLLLGGLVAALAGARYALRPSRAYGPVGVAASAAAIAYLIVLAREATVTVHLGSSGALSLGYGDVLDLLAIAPAVALVASLVTTVEDVRWPGERLAVDFPARMSA